MKCLIHYDWVSRSSFQSRPMAYYDINRNYGVDQVEWSRKIRYINVFSYQYYYILSLFSRPGMETLGKLQYQVLSKEEKDNNITAKAWVESVWVHSRKWEIQCLIVFSFIYPATWTAKSCIPTWYLTWRHLEITWPCHIYSSMGLIIEKDLLRRFWFQSDVSYWLTILLENLWSELLESFVYYAPKCIH